MTSRCCPSQTPPPPPPRPSSCRWGDYAGASVDPTNGSVIWGTNELNGPQAGGSAQWATQHFALTATDVPPTASFTSSGSSPSSPVTFNATGSSDLDGTVTSYSWNSGDGNTGSGATASHLYGKSGTFPVTLTVTDNGGQTAQVTHLVVFDEVPAFAVKTSSPGTGQPVSFDGSASKDPDGSIVTHLWNFGDGKTGSGKRPSHAYKKAGSYTVTLAVIDSSSSTDVIAHTVKISKAKISKVSVKHKTGSGATLLITVNAPGKQSAGGKPTKLKGHGTTKLKLQLTSTEQNVLATTGSLTVQVQIKFVPKVGKSSTKTVTIKFP